MAEIFALSDRVTVLRDGAYVATVVTAETTPRELASRMVGRDLVNLYPPKADGPRRPARLTVDGVADGTGIADIRFAVAPGEILGLGGLIGAGRSEMAQLVCGLRDRVAGTVRLDGRDLGRGGYREAISKGVVYLSEDRRAAACSLISASPRTSRRSICAACRGTGR
jgi:ribose transport system ATP-binding protein